MVFSSPLEEMVFSRAAGSSFAVFASVGESLSVSDACVDFSGDIGMVGKYQGV